VHYVITGAGGFVMSVLTRHLLATHADLTVTALDRDEPDEFTRAHLTDFADRVTFARADVTDATALTELVGTSTDAIVHGATVTHDAGSERRNPARFIDVNVVGALNVLEVARTAAIGTVLMVSSGAVYGRNPQTVLDESSRCEPDEMYGVSKVASELMAQRYAELVDMRVPIVRLTKMYGAMERPTSGRAVMSLPYHLARAALRESVAAVTPRTLSAGGDWLSAATAVDAIGMILDSDISGSPVFNISSGVRTAVPELAAGFGVELVTEEDAFDMDPDSEFGKNGVYVNDRAVHEIGWRPSGLGDQAQTYLAWARDNPGFFK
jgi:nucleoside-diphosphate-sugar epimerase